MSKETIKESTQTLAKENEFFVPMIDSSDEFKNRYEIIESSRNREVFKSTNKLRRK